MGLFDSNDDESQAYLKQALDAYSAANVPTIASETVNGLPMESVQGTVNAAPIQVAEQAPTAYNDISLDPATRAAQMAALGQYTNIADAGGLDANAKLAIQQANDAATTQARGEQGAIMDAARASGNAGGDFALTQRALAAQGESNTAATNGMTAAAEAEANREAALNAMATIGGNVNASDYGQAANKAASTNAINATNTAATNTANTGNVANAINTGEFNTNTAQDVNAANTTAGQNKVYYNAALPQQQFNNELAKAGGIAGVSGAQANAAQAATNANNAVTGSLLGAAGTVGAAALGGPAAGAAAGSVARTAKPVSASKGGYICYADGGVTHDHAICMKLGGHVPGEAEVGGDSPENDTVPAMLSPGEIVIKRSKASNPDEAAKEAKKISAEHFMKGYKRGN